MPYFKLPKWALGLAKIVKDVLIFVTSASLLTDASVTMADIKIGFWVYIFREALGSLIKYSESPSKTKKEDE
jgi:hypothetical protein